MSQIAFTACFPENTWFGIGLGGSNPKSAELIFFMAPKDESLRKVISTRIREGADRPDDFPIESPLYQSNISSCGPNMIYFETRRPLVCADPNQTICKGVEPIYVERSIDMIVAGIYTVFDTLYENIPTHEGG